MTRTITLILALLMVFSLVACSSENNLDESPVDPTSPQVSTGDQGSDPNEGESPYGAGLPLVNEPVSFTFWIPMDAAVAPYLMDLNDGNIFYQEMEKRTGVHIEFIHPPATNVNDQFNLMVVSEIWPDVVTNVGMYYAGGPDKAIADNFIIDLGDLIADYAPNYTAIVESDKDVRRAVFTNGGHQPAFCQIRDRKQTQFMGMLLREDWLNELNMEAPETFDDWHKVLTAFTEFTDGAGPLFLTNTATYTGNIFAGALGIAVGTEPFYLNENNKVAYGPIQPAYKEYVSMLADWYAEGLVDADFVSRSEVLNPNTSMLSNNQIGAFCGMYIHADKYFVDIGIVTDENFSLTLAPIPVKTAGDEPRVGYYSARCPGNTGGNSITTVCNNPELVTKWHDYVYSDAGTLLANYGLEGISFEYDEDGQPRANDLICHNSEGLGKSQAQFRYLIQTGSHLFLQDREDAVLTGNQAKYVSLWRHDYPGNLPRFSLASDDSAELSSIMNDVNTFVEEWTVKVVMGNIPLDDFDNFTDMLKSMSIEKAVSLMQKAWEDYSSR